MLAVKIFMRYPPLKPKNGFFCRFAGSIFNGGKHKKKYTTKNFIEKFWITKYFWKKNSKRSEKTTFTATVVLTPVIKKAGDNVKEIENKKLLAYIYNHAFNLINLLRLLIFTKTQDAQELYRVKSDVITMKRLTILKSIVTTLVLLHILNGNI